MHFDKYYFVLGDFKTGASWIIWILGILDRKTILIKISILMTEDLEKTSQKTKTNRKTDLV